MNTESRTSTKTPDKNMRNDISKPKTEQLILDKPMYFRITRSQRFTIEGAFTSARLLEDYDTLYHELYRLFSIPGV